MLPLQFILLLLIVSLPRQLAETAPGPGMPPALHLLSAPLAYLSLILAQGGVVLVALFQTRRTIRRLHEPSAAAAAISWKADVTFAQCRLGASFLTAVALFATPLAGTLLRWFGSSAVLSYLMVPELVFLLPAVLAWLAIWTAGYYLEEALRQRSLPYQLAQAAPVHDMPPLGSYLGMQARHNFFPVFFLYVEGFVSAAADTTLRLTHSQAQAGAAEFGATVVSLAVLMALLPWFLTRIWSTTPLLGALRERLEKVAARYGLRFGDIRLWRTHHLILNAAVVGWLPRGRYFLMSDTLVESLSDEQLEAVFAHEVGHGIHRHLPWMMGAVLSVVALATGVGGLAAAALPLRGETGDMVSLGLSSVALCVVGAAVIGWISPRFEHQADWFACRHMALRLRESPGGLSPGAGDGLPPALRNALPDTPSAAERVTLAQYRAGEYPHIPLGGALPEAVGAAAGAAPPEVAGAEVFISSLDAILETAHRDRNRRGLFHPSAARRTALLRRLALDPEAEVRFQRALRRVRWFIVLLAVVGLATFGAAAFVEGTPPPANGNAAATAVAPVEAP